jgi:hypothetical protein
MELHFLMSSISVSLNINITIVRGRHNIGCCPCWLISRPFLFGIYILCNTKKKFLLRIDIYTVMLICHKNVVSDMTRYLQYNIALTCIYVLSECQETYKLYFNYLRKLYDFVSMIYIKRWNYTS